MADFTLHKSVEFAGEKVKEARELEGSGVLIHEPTALPAYRATLDARAAADDGAVLMQTLNTIANGDRVDLFWDGGHRRGMVVGAIPDMVVEISGGDGDDLPSVGTQVSIVAPERRNIQINGAALLSLGLYAPGGGLIVFCNAAEEEVYYAYSADRYFLVWHKNNGATNPLLGKNVRYIYVSHAEVTGQRTFGVAVNVDGSIPFNRPPTIEVPSDQTILMNTVLDALEFTVDDPDEGDELTVTASSSDQDIVPDENIVLGGSGNDRTITITPVANRFGEATITLTVSDGDYETSDTFDVLVLLTGQPDENEDFQVDEDGRPQIVDVGAVNVAPTITFDGGGASANVTVQAEATAVATITATDTEGLAENPWSISGGADAALFTINAATGALAFLTYAEEGTYTVIVRVTDTSGATDSQTINVTVPRPTALVELNPEISGAVKSDIAGTTNQTSNGGQVGQLVDQSGNGNHTPASSTVAYPVLFTNSWDGSDGVLFSGIAAAQGSAMLVPNSAALKTAKGRFWFSFAAQFTVARDRCVFGSSASGGAYNVYCAYTPAKKLNFIISGPSAVINCTTTFTVDIGERFGCLIYGDGTKVYISKNGGAFEEFTITGTVSDSNNAANCSIFAATGTTGYTGGGLLRYFTAGAAKPVAGHRTALQAALAALSGGYGTASKRIAILGDSISATSGLINWVQRSAVELGPDVVLGNFSVPSGAFNDADPTKNLNTIWTNSIKNKGYNVLAIPGATNNLGAGESAATVFAAMTTIADEALGLGMKVVYFTVLPRGASSGWDATKQGHLEDYNDQTRSEATANSMLCVDLYTPTFQNPAPNETELKTSLGSGDGLHIDDDGAVEVKNSAVPVFSAVTP